ncbi:MAG: hypothetical protein J7604_22575 [Sporocytophaga sp.]|uniref:hypothetical protein n=1 Tax=Sporocytophaga sp. TaxID=2231183 RepID=UPI001B1004E5|nr:hypothetical protein [Sporocytophaga sp.]MBO9703017.1 hypothetical protein [Sporocytophaga sp.]
MTKTISITFKTLALTAGISNSQNNEVCNPVYSVNLYPFNETPGLTYETYLTISEMVNYKCDLAVAGQSPLKQCTWNLN